MRVLKLFVAASAGYLLKKSSRQFCRVVCLLSCTAVDLGFMCIIICRVDVDGGVQWIRDL